MPHLHHQATQAGKHGRLGLVNIGRLRLVNTGRLRLVKYRPVIDKVQAKKVSVDKEDLSTASEVDFSIIGIKKQDTQKRQSDQELSGPIATLRNLIDTQLEILRYLCTCDKFGRDNVAAYFKMAQPAGMKWKPSEKEIMLNAIAFFIPKHQSDGTILNGYEQVRIMLIESHANAVSESITLSNALLSQLSLDKTIIEVHVSFLARASHEMMELTQLHLSKNVL